MVTVTVTVTDTDKGNNGMRVGLVIFCFLLVFISNGFLKNVV